MKILWGCASLLAVPLVLVLACEQDKPKDKEAPKEHPGVSEVKPVDIEANEAGFQFLAKMPGHWVGSNVVTGQNYPWFAFDYRAISNSHAFGIFEGGSLGNLLTSFFVTNYKGVRTIMARNGGVLGRIYRSSYFVLDDVTTEGGKSCYRFVDAVGGKNIMWMSLCFAGESLAFKAYRSRLGRTFPPELHMDFNATRKNGDLATTAATAVGYPDKTVTKDLSQGFVESDLYRNEGTDKAVSATFLARDTGDLATKAAAARDPFKPGDHPRIAKLKVEVTRAGDTVGKKVFLLLSKDPLADDSGKIGGEAQLDTILQFPTLEPSAASYQFYYLHPGRYYVTAIADTNGDETFSKGDACSKSVAVDIAPESDQTYTISSMGIIY